MAKPQCVETTVNRSGGGKVAIIDYGRVSSDYHVSITRKYAIPATWSDDQVEQFEDEQLAILKTRIDPVLDAEFAERWNQKVWEGDE